MLYQLSYFRIRLFYSYRPLTIFCWMFLAKVSFHFISLGQGYAPLLRIALQSKNNGHPFFATANVKMFIGFSKKTDNNFNGE